MGASKLKTAGKTGLPFILASVLCGYANDQITNFIPPGDVQDWAYRSIPFFSLCILFLIKVLRDVGGLTISQIVFSKFAANPRKKALRKIIDDTYASIEVRDIAKKEYDEIVCAEIINSSALFEYISAFSPKKITPPKIPTQGQD